MRSRAWGGTAAVVLAGLLAAGCGGGEKKTADESAGKAVSGDFPLTVTDCAGVRTTVPSDAAHAALNDDRLGKNHGRGNDRWRARASIMPEPQHSQLQVHLLHQDPPKHTRMRRFVTDAFTPRRVEQLLCDGERQGHPPVDRKYVPSRAIADGLRGLSTRST